MECRKTNRIIFDDNDIDYIYWFCAIPQKGLYGITVFRNGRKSFIKRPMTEFEANIFKGLVNTGNTTEITTTAEYTVTIK